MKSAEINTNTCDYDFTCFRERIEKSTDLEKLIQEKKLIESYHTLEKGEKDEKIAIINAQISFLQRTWLMKIFKDRIARAFWQR